jgi:L-lactate dehydrogenase complex protein LldG
MSTMGPDAGNAAKEEILRRIRGALDGVAHNEQPRDVPIHRNYRAASEESHAQIVAQFAERVAEYRAVVQRVTSTDLPGAIGEACARRNVRRLVVPEDIPEDWVPRNLDVLRDVRAVPLSYEQLDTSDGVLTGCALGIAQTGTIILDGGPAQGRRAVSLLPDYHLCVVFEHQVVALVPGAISRLGDTVRRVGRPITLISGPSATSDIELNRVEGVHGPRTLEVLVVAE